MQTQSEQPPVRGALRLTASPELRKRLKIRAAELGTTMYEYVTEAVLDRLDREDAQGEEANGSK